MNFYRFKRFFLIFCLTSLLSGCHEGLFFPAGEISIQQKNLILISFFVMLLVIIPVIFMTIFFSYKYRKKSINKDYNPDWNHSYIIEFFTWGIPILIIFFLSILSWKKTHELDPRKSLQVQSTPIKIEVVSLDWKWLFIYPKQKIISVNELVLPTNVPIEFYITSNAVMNSFFIPSLGSQVYAMPGMTSKLNLISNFSGIYKGISSNYSGAGFSDMKFKVISTINYKFFNSWLNKVKKIGKNIFTFNDFKKVYTNKLIKYFSFNDLKLIEKFIQKGN
ncbi:MAG: ubiquinol oxidase subunit II [Buchnera aphidicola (Periphyllus acericola)]|uniref:ubiquinol oxidase subunit II n=1 Tax=Buchnera aphidicola TaxID=9 RepID=UPI0030D5F183|nr:ubiquinol oxidase subunit II [Buchnera aphidicola (Periphyllus acericola)]